MTERHQLCCDRCGAWSAYYEDERGYPDGWGEVMLYHLCPHCVNEFNQWMGKTPFLNL